jgi:hypothetical protein
VAPVAAAVALPAAPARDRAPGPTDADVVADGDSADSAPALAPEAATTGTAAAVTGPDGVLCEGDGVSGKRVQVLYVRGAATPSRFGQFLESFRTWAAGVDVIYNASAKETGGVRRIRFVTTPDCRVDVQEVEVPAAAIGDFGATNSALKSLGFNRTDRKYMQFADSKVYCGIGSFAGDDRTGAVNRSNGGPSYGRSDSGCWTASVAAHELGHNLGAVNNNAPNSSKAGHCLDEYDVMCYNDSGGLKTHVVCAERSHEQRLDCNHDDYYNANPAAGSYLATHWNVAENAFLVRDDGGNPNPGPSVTASASPTASATRNTSPSPSASASATASPTPSASPTTSPTRNTSPSPTGVGPTGSLTPDPGPSTLKPLRVSDVTTTSARLSWDSAGSGVRYAILYGTRSLGTTRGTTVRIVGMRPDTDYRFQIAKVNADGGRTPYTVVATVHTAPAATLAGGAWMILTNALTGGAADLFGARSADGTPLVLHRRAGGANQQWKLEPVPGGGYLLRSKATGRCVGAQGGATVTGTPLVQIACDQNNAAEVWHVSQTRHGTSLSTSGGLVVGVSAQRFGGSRLLVLQRPSSSRYQSWTALAG